MPYSTQISTAIRAAEHPVLLESAAQLSAAAKDWQACASLGIDTEFVRERTYRADLGLVQISDGETAWLADPISIGSLEPLTELLATQNITKILHSGSEDLEVLLHVLGVLPEPLVDTQIACAMLGQPLQMGYHHAMKWLFDVDIAKDQTRSNWCRRPLHSKQLLYAAMDVVLLPLLMQELRQKLEECGRWEWLEEDVSRMQRSTLSPVTPENAWLRFPNIGRLDDSTLKVLQALAAWRERAAQNKNRARGFVVSDAGLMQMARIRPSRPEEIRDINELHPGMLRRYQDQLLQLIAAAHSDSREIERIKNLSNDQNRQLNAMRKIVISRAEELGIDPALLASKKELEKLIRALSEDQPLPERFLGWRKRVITDDLLQQIVK
jgi:ribonuclease D